MSELIESLLAENKKLTKTKSKKVVKEGYGSEIEDLVSQITEVENLLFTMIDEQEDSDPKYEILIEIADRFNEVDDLLYKLDKVKLEDSVQVKKKKMTEAPDRFGFEYDDEVSDRYAQELEKEKNFIADSRQRAEKLEAQIKEKLPDAVKMMETLPPNKEYWDKVIVPHQVEFLVTDSDVRVFYYATYPSKTEKIAGLGKDGTVKIWGYAGKPSEAEFSTYPRYVAAIKAMQAFVDYFDQFKEEFYKKFPQQD